MSMVKKIVSSEMRRAAGTQEKEKGLRSETGEMTGGHYRDYDLIDTLYNMLIFKVQGLTSIGD